MTVGVEQINWAYTGNGATDVWGFTFSSKSDSDVEVYLKEGALAEVKLNSADYTLSRTDSGGNVTYPKTGSKLTSSDRIAVKRNSVKGNDYDFKSQARVNTIEIENSDDDKARQIQELSEEISRSVQVEPTSEVNPADLINQLTDDVATASLNAASTSADVVSTNADVVSTNANVVSTSASAAAAASSAAEGLYNIVDNRNFSDSPISPLLTEEGWLYKIDTSGGNVVVNLSSLATYGEDMKFAFVKNTPDANTITINRGGTDTISGAASATISLQYETNVITGDTETGEWIKSVQSAALEDGSVTETKLAPMGTVGQVMTSNGSSPPTMQDSAGAWELVSSLDVTSPTPNVEFTSWIDSIYDNYKIVLHGVTCDASYSLHLYVSTDNGATWIIAGIPYNWVNTYNKATVVSPAGHGVVGNSQWSFMNPLSVAATATSSSNGELTFFDLNSTVSHKTFSSSINIVEGTTDVIKITGTGAVETTSPINALHIFTNSGNIVSGSFRLYGLKKG